MKISWSFTLERSSRMAFSLCCQINHLSDCDQFFRTSPQITSFPTVLRSSQEADHQIFLYCNTACCGRRSRPDGHFLDGEVFDFSTNRTILLILDIVIGSSSV